ncbi:MAG: DUF948 domain-containing protein [Deltaproteobacteria bacterium]|nr:DUF948 domain-containing protein [Deltaproteobacteria bacterium]
MSVVMDTVLVLLGLGLLVLVGFAIPCLLQILQAVKEMTLTIRTLNERLPAIMKNLEGVTTDVGRTTAAVQSQFEDLSLVISKAKGALFVLVGLEEIIRRRVRLPFVPTLGTVLAVLKGIRVFLSHLLGDRPKRG